MPLLFRAKSVFPNKFVHKGWSVVCFAGVYYGVPGHLDVEQLVLGPQFRSHPAILKAMTRSAILELIDFQSQTAAIEEGACEGYRLVRRGAIVHAIPPGADWVDLDLDEERRNAGVISGDSFEEVVARVQMVQDSVPVEFAGWLPIYKLMGNCGRHPQFAHTHSPPEGYCFTRSATSQGGDITKEPAERDLLSRFAGIIFKGSKLAESASQMAFVFLRKLLWPFLAAFYHSAHIPLFTRLKLMGAIIRMYKMLRRGGGRLIPVLRFLQSRSLHSQILMAANRRLTFLTSVPYTYNQSPWIVEIEDLTTLFFPFIHNGQTSQINISDSPWFPIVKTLLESDQCRGILTHMRSTADMLPNLFRSDIISRKVRYHPLGVKLPRQWQQHEEEKPEQINLLFINSWSQHPGNFQIRGGLDVLEAFDILRKRYPHLRLTMRTSMMPLDEHYHRIIESGWVRIIDRFLSVDEMESLHAESHIYLLPAARIHIVSLLQAMASGLAVVSSDGWGFNEYLTDGHNGLIVKGRYGKTSWVDEEAGMLRENYDPMTSPDAEVVQGIVDAVSRLVEDDDLRRRLGRTARQDVENNYTLTNWNAGLKALFDSALFDSAHSGSDRKDQEKSTGPRLFPVVEELDVSSSGEARC